VERSGQVLSSLGVDPRLAADRGIDHPDQGRRDSDPAKAAKKRRRGEARHVGRRSAAEADDPALTADLELVPQMLDHSRCLRLLAGRDEMRRQPHRADSRELVE
jgi:hypothetical protein